MTSDTITVSELRAAYTAALERPSSVHVELDGDESFVTIDGVRRKLVPDPPAPANADPRVKHGEGPNPNMPGLRALVNDVHYKLDALGVPRYLDGDEFTMLGRVSYLLAAYKIERL